MSTRSRIGLELPSGHVVSVYHHWDGYPEWLGKRLVEKYDTVDKIKKLIDGGDISSIDSNSSWDRMDLDENIVLYYRDRGEENVDPELHDDVIEYLEYANGQGCDYAYIFANGEWRYFMVPADLENEPKGEHLITFNPSLN